MAQEGVGGYYQAESSWYSINEVSFIWMYEDRQGKKQGEGPCWLSGDLSFVISIII